MIVLLLVTVFGLFLVNYQFANNNHGGTDFLVHYTGARATIFEGINPYSDEVATRIQIAAYGHPAEGVEHELRAAFPLYAIFLFAPFSIIGNYVLARAVWMTVLEAALILMAFLSPRLVDWKPDIKLYGGILLFSLIWYHSARGILNGNAVILISLLITAALLMIKKGQDAQAGLLLAITTIKPDLILIFLTFVLFWAIYQKRWKLIIWFLGSMIVFIGLSLILIPGWIYQYFWEVLRYPGSNLVDALTEWIPSLGIYLKWIIAVPLGFLICIESWRARKGNFTQLLWTSLLMLIIGQWTGYRAEPGGLALLFPALILILSILALRWKTIGSFIAGGLLVLFFFLPWMLVVLNLRGNYQPDQSLLLSILVPLVCFLGLYWIRWWVISPASAILLEDL